MDEETAVGLAEFLEANGMDKAEAGREVTSGDWIINCYLGEVVYFTIRNAEAWPNASAETDRLEKEESETRLAGPSIVEQLMGRCARS